MSQSDAIAANMVSNLGPLSAAFLTVKHEDIVNTMTIGWGSHGIFWNRPIFIVAVRTARYTNEILEKALEFTVTIPEDDALKEALALCGRVSGRDQDKITAAGLVTLPSKAIQTPIIAGTARQYECTVVYRQAMTDEALLSQEIKQRSYMPEHGPGHIFYYGEVLQAYRTNA